AISALSTLSLHDALPIFDDNGLGAFFAVPGDLAQTALLGGSKLANVHVNFSFAGVESGTVSNPFNSFEEGLASVLSGGTIRLNGDRKSTRLNSSYVKISY